MSATSAVYDIQQTSPIVLFQNFRNVLAQEHGNVATTRGKSAQPVVLSSAGSDREWSYISLSISARPFPARDY